MMFGAVITTVGLIIAILAFGGDRFDGGVQLTGASVQQAINAETRATNAEKIAKDNAERMKDLGGKLNTILDILGERAKK